MLVSWWSVEADVIGQTRRFIPDDILEKAWLVPGIFIEIFYSARLFFIPRLVPMKIWKISIILSLDLHTRRPVFTAAMTKKKKNEYPRKTLNNARCCIHDCQRATFCDRITSGMTPPRRPETPVYLNFRPANNSDRSKITRKSFRWRKQIYHGRKLSELYLVIFSTDFNFLQSKKKKNWIESLFFTLNIQRKTAFKQARNSKLMQNIFCPAEWSRRALVFFFFFPSSLSLSLAIFFGCSFGAGKYVKTEMDNVIQGERLMRKMRPYERKINLNYTVYSEKKKKSNYPEYPGCLGWKLIIFMRPRVGDTSVKKEKKVYLFIDE